MSAKSSNFVALLYTNETIKIQIEHEETFIFEHDARIAYGM